MSEDRNPESLRARGDQYFERREYQQAINCYEAVIDQVPGLEIARYHYLVGRAKEVRGDMEQAFLRYQAAIELEPHFVDPYVEMGGLLMKVGAPEGAVQAYRDSVRLEPENAANHHNLVAVLKVLCAKEPEQFASELADAEAAYRSALERTGGTIPQR